jgi:hypothetical protein
MYGSVVPPHLPSASPRLSSGHLSLPTSRDIHLQFRYSAAVTAEQIRVLVLAIPEGSLCFRTARCDPWGPDRKSRREAQTAYALSEPRFGWYVAKTFADHGQLIPAGVRVAAIRRANYHLLGYTDQAVKEALELIQPRKRYLEVILKGLLASRDIDIPGIAKYLSIRPETVGIYSDLFFNVHDRLEDDWYMSGIAYPETRLGQVLEAEQDGDDLELTFIRAGYSGSWQDVARLAGSAPIADDEDLEFGLEKLEREIVGNAEMLSWMGHLNREKSPGIWLGEGLLATAEGKKKEARPVDLAPPMTVAEAIQGSFDRLMGGGDQYQAILKAQEQGGGKT